MIATYTEVNSFKLPVTRTKCVIVFGNVYGGPINPNRSNRDEL